MASANNDFTPEKKCNQGGDIIPSEAKQRLRNAVCCIKTPRHLGTGFYAVTKIGNIERKCIFTCFHVVPNKTIASASTYYFLYNKTIQEAIPIRFQPENFYTGGKEGSDDDYTIMECPDSTIKKLEEENHIQPIPLEPIMISQLQARPVWVVQHPAGHRLSESTHTITDFDQKMVHYQADTLGGSSGSPVFITWNQKSLLLAIHIGSKTYNAGIHINSIIGKLNPKPEIDEQKVLDEQKVVDEQKVLDEQKVFIHLLIKRIAAKKKKIQKDFAVYLIQVCDNDKELDDASDDVDEIFQHGHPLMELIWTMENKYSLLKDVKCRAKIRKALNDANLAGVEVTERNLKSFYEKLRHNKKNDCSIDFTRKEQRMKIYKELGNWMSTNAILIAYFLLSTKDFNSIEFNNQESDRDLLNEVFMKWDEVEKTNLTWSMLRSVLLGLDFKNPVEVIEKSFGDKKEKKYED